MELSIMERERLKDMLASYKGSFARKKAAMLALDKLELTPDEREKANYGHVYQCARCKERKFSVAKVDECWMDNCDSKKIHRSQRPLWSEDLLADVEISATAEAILQDEIQSLYDAEEVDDVVFTLCEKFLDIKSLENEEE